MDSYTLQLIILAGAYALAALLAVAATISSVASYRSSKSVTLRQSAETRLTTLEGQLDSVLASLERVRKRQIKEKFDAKKREQLNAATDRPDGGQPDADPDDFREGLVAEFNRARR